MARVVPGILTADEKDYARRLKLAADVCGLIQIDLVDGLFSENKTVQSDVIAKYPTGAELEIQLMVNYPENYIDDLGRLEYVSRIIFPLEIEGDINTYVATIKKFDKEVGISLNPETPILSAKHYLCDIDLLLLMTGTPGYSGQKLGEDTYKRIEEVKSIDSDIQLEIDIGVNFENAARLAAAGADFLVASSALYGAPDFGGAYERLAKLAADGE